VVLEAHFAGKRCRWSGTIVRSEAIVDSRSRMVYLVASVPRPYERTDASGGQPLAVGMFVQAAIRCAPIADAVVLPEACVGHDGKLFVIGPDGRLEPREVEVLRREGTWVVARGDFADGESVCATRVEHPNRDNKPANAAFERKLDNAIPEMRVNVVEYVESEFVALDQGGLVDLSAAATSVAERGDEPAMTE
jgi:hypothetical protein